MKIKIAIPSIGIMPSGDESFITKDTSFEHLKLKFIHSFKQVNQ